MTAGSRNCPLHTGRSKKDLERQQCGVDFVCRCTRHRPSRVVRGRQLPNMLADHRGHPGAARDRVDLDSPGAASTTAAQRGRSARRPGPIARVARLRPSHARHKRAPHDAAARQLRTRSLGGTWHCIRQTLVASEFTLGGCCAWTAGTDGDWTMHGCAARRYVETKAFKVGIGFGVACAGLS